MNISQSTNADLLARIYELQQKRKEAQAIINECKTLEKPLIDLLLARHIPLGETRTYDGYTVKLSLVKMPERVLPECEFYRTTIRKLNGV